MKKSFIIPLILILLTLPSLLPLFNAKFFYTQDHIFIARLHQISTVLLAGIFPARWAPDLRYGEPLYNFYASLPYYLGAAIRLLGLNFIWVAKILFMLSSILSAMTMYIFCRKLFSKKAAILGSALYVYAPYRAVDIYVRGALSEAWAFIFFPLIFYTVILLREKATFARVSLLAFSLAGLFLTHNVTTLMFLPFLAIFVIYLFFKNISFKKENWKFVLSFLGSFALSLGLAAFFLLPASFERQFIQTKYLIVGYFDFRAHFVAFAQLFSTFWGYGSSLWGRSDGLSFQIGLVHWFILALAVILGFIFRKDRKLLLLLSFLGLSFVFSIFLQHNKSAFIWEAIPLMAFIQFPWRFLAISIFIVAISGAVVADNLRGRLNIIYFILLLLVITVNLQYFRPKEYVDDSFFDKFLRVESMHQGIDLTKDYLPIWVQTVDGERFDDPRAEEGEIQVNSFTREPQSAQGSITVLTDSTIELPITYFPGWEVTVNNQSINLQPPSKQGLVRFELPKGQYNIGVEFKDTSVRTIGNVLSLVSVLLVVGAFAIKRYKLR